ncbi:MAG: IS110 family transposase [Candidatus Brocadia sp. WS118]|nr:MAG: IS110 family transposase [Candidatus Brocadia sp. WS118]
MYYVGLDIHKKYCISAVMDKEGKMLDRRRIESKPQALKHYFNELPEPCHVAMEACYNWGYFLDILEDVTEEISLAHPLKTRLIAETRIKTDAIDAKVLADLLRTNLLPLAYIPGSETRRLKNFLRYRAGLAAMNTQVKNKIHALLDQHEFAEKETLAQLTDLFGKQGRHLLTEVCLPGQDTQILKSWMNLWEHIHQEILKADVWIRHHAKEDPLSSLLQTIPGIGAQFALLVRYEIDQIERFRTAKKLVSYAGLAPSTYSSGGKTRHGGITKQGNKWLRWAFVEAAQRAPLTSPYFKQYYERIKDRAGWDRARVATARKIAEAVFGVMKNQQVYQEHLLGQLPSKGSSRLVA